MLNLRGIKQEYTNNITSKNSHIVFFFLIWIRSFGFILETEILKKRLEGSNTQGSLFKFKKYLLTK